MGRVVPDVHVQAASAPLPPKAVPVLALVVPATFCVKFTGLGVIEKPVRCEAASAIPANANTVKAVNAENRDSRFACKNPEATFVDNRVDGLKFFMAKPL